MRKSKSYRIDQGKVAKGKLLFWAQKFEQICVLDSNSQTNGNNGDFQYKSLDCKVAIGAYSELHGIGKNDFDRLKTYVDEIGDWVFGYLSYDLKNQLEELKSENLDSLKFPTLHFFQPELIVELVDTTLTISYLEEVMTEHEIDKMFQEIMDVQVETEPIAYTDIESRISKSDYLDAVNKLKDHIAYGDIYEVNFCQEFYSNSAINVSPLQIYERLNEISMTPFASFYRNGSQYLMSASPERFLRKQGNLLISQPIKGTRRRGDSESLDSVYKEELAKSAKERSENVMIVDIVRNDLAKSAVKGTVEVEDLFGIYTFEQVHHMISTVKCECREDVHPIDAIKAAFPMGSMTGAPKIKAMQLIEEYESTRRGLYSGAVGYITPNKDFDFNVVIRSILYNAEESYLSFIVGGAITDMARAEEEYEECMVKARAMFEVLNVTEVVH